jgi:predicted nucleic acid-binding protein
MSTDPAEERLVFLDACCLINLFASGRAEDILRALPYRFVVARYVAEEEVLEVGSNAAEEDDHEGRVALRPLISDLIEKEVVTALAVSSGDEQSELVRFAVDLDDGEAHTCALAITRGAQVATDDKKAIRVFQEALEETAAGATARRSVVRTSELLFDWADRHQVPEPDLVKIVRAVARRATFLPPKSDPHFERWMKLLEGGD